MDYFNNQVLALEDQSDEMGGDIYISLEATCGITHAIQQCIYWTAAQTWDCDWVLAEGYFGTEDEEHERQYNNQK